MIAVDRVFTPMNTSSRPRTRIIACKKVTDQTCLSTKKKTVEAAVTTGVWLHAK